MFRFNTSHLAKTKHFTKLKSKFLVFLFPFYPFKLFTTINLMTFYALLFGLRLGLSFLNIKITGVHTTISFAWLPLMVMGWYFGPVIGFLSGILTDTVSWLLHPGVWFWLYAIQEPILGLIAGLLGSFAQLRKHTNRPIIDLIISQFFYFIFIVFTFFLVIQLVNLDTPVFRLLNKKKSQFNIEDEFINTFKYLALAFLSAFFICTETFIIVYYFKNRQKDKKHLIYFLYASMIALTSTLLFSFALGPISSVMYLEYIGKKATLYLKYGANYYLLPRIIKESIKTPIYIILLSTVIQSFDFVVTNLKNIARNKWHKTPFWLPKKLIKPR
ncbi:ECF transporter S component [Ureaplasma miroungigenitalium]|uniref:ECF transporter S component n=1 Tax=Ureaplasma miroungigenitalium TaxID=1042321 RepID=A0ABT3BMP9_9BACT|nr:ECF transporter S component [Ureaplasma miroungigenitalium]MCV3728307.1 ECF transporter S component [Ureaplasma miroungigenitalium]MCV3734112.1 ECF transporter S component [Ureaplasma miroungigenitalium]